jgi:predicted RNA-binding protein with RPS1 domain
MKLSGKVTRVMDYGCFVAFDNSKISALCHVSEITTEFVKVGTIVDSHSSYFISRTSIR